MGKLTEWLVGHAAELKGLAPRLAPLRVPAAEHELTLPRGRHPGSRRRTFLVRTPVGHDGTRPAPLVMVLHGCLQDHRDIQSISNFDYVADRCGFVTVYPFVTSYRDRRLRHCWGWWRSSEIQPGRGEVQDLWEIVEQVQCDFNVDARRIHIAGISAGGAMAVAALVVHADRVASGGVVAGVPYSETHRAVRRPGWSGSRFKATDSVVDAMQRAMTGATRRRVPIFIVHSHADTVIDVQAARNLRDTWASCFGVNTQKFVRVRRGKTRGTEWSHSAYGPPGRRSVIETLLMEGVGHGWSGGNPGRFSYPDGPDISAMMWRFFRRHPMERRRLQRVA